MEGGPSSSIRFLRQGLKAHLPKMAIRRDSLGNFEALHHYK